jgi:hypothetical protein
MLDRLAVAVHNNSSRNAVPEVVMGELLKSTHMLRCSSIAITGDHFYDPSYALGLIEIEAFWEPALRSPDIPDK